MLVWSGRGIVVPLFNFIAFMGYAFSLTPIHGHLSPLARVAVFATDAAIFGGACAGAIYLVTVRTERTPPRNFVEEASGRRVQFRRSAGSFFFIPTRYWPAFTLGVWALVAWGGILGPELR